MWIVLLDHSGSMGEPFSGIPNGNSRLNRTIESEIKLEAAKEALLEEITELGKDVPVVIFGFTSEAHLVFEGTANQKSKLESSLDSLEATNGTNIATALDIAADYRLNNKTTDLARIVLISDGKSDRDKAKAAGRRCMKNGMGIHFILIDPTEEGKTFAREVVGHLGGTFFTVTCRSQLKELTKDVGVSYRQDQARAESYLRSATEQAEVVQMEADMREEVVFTVGYQRRIRPNFTYPMLVWIHLISMHKEIEHRLKELANKLGEAPHRTQIDSNARIPIGTQLEIIPRIKGVAAYPSCQQLTWFGEIEEAGFKVRIVDNPDPNQIYAGFIDITAGGLLLGQVPISFSVQKTKPRLSLELTATQMISRVFASYEHHDLGIVRACKVAYKGLGINLFIDKDEILAGQPWQDVIRRNIGYHDLFQLFWSQSAANSTEVANEYELALSIASQRIEPFIRPVYWETPMVDPPSKLAKLNFAFLDLKALNLENVDMIQAESISSKKIQASFPIVDIIGYDKQIVSQLQNDISEIVPFLENLLGARYYPPISLTVDEHTIKTIRHSVAPSGKLNNSTYSEETKNIIIFLHSLALAFHFGKLVPGDVNRKQMADFFNASDDLSKNEFEHITCMSEWIFEGPLRDYIEGKDIWSSAFKSMKRSLEEVVSGNRNVWNNRYVWNNWDIAHMLDWLQEVSLNKDRESVIGFITKELIDNLTSSDPGRSKHAAVMILKSSIPELADKYNVYKFFEQVTRTDLRLCRTFPEYINHFCLQWLKYIEIALIKFGDIVIDNHFTVPESAIKLLTRCQPNIDFLQIRKVQQFFKNSTEPGFCYKLQLTHYQQCVSYLSGQLQKLLNQNNYSASVSMLSTAESTYGVFLCSSAINAQNQLERTLEQHGWPKESSMPGQNKVLVCMGAIERIKSVLISSTKNETSAIDLARRIALAVLVHEHFHSAVACAVDRNGQSSIGFQNPMDWQKAYALNEALAIWAERHFFRKDAEMLAHIDSYIYFGEYPSWPYRSAEFIEKLYLKGGIPSVRGWIQYLRDDPINAQREFDYRLKCV